jgi:serine/threonine-protein kinase
MTADLTLRLGEIGADLAKRAPLVLYAVVAALESLQRALDATQPERYQVGPPIGTGGTAEVFLGVAQGVHGFQRPVAIKRARVEQDHPRAFASMLIEEALQVARLSHDNVIAAFDFERDAEGRCFLVMEYIDGIDLKALIATGPIPLSVAIFIVTELLAGLGYLHRSQDFGRGRVGGLVHRDVKPANVLLSWQGAVKLGDLGLALMFEQGGTVEARGREGTFWYMSPEQSRREALDGRSDLYAAGVVLWELLARHRLRSAPIDGTPDSFQPIPHPSEYQEIPADVEAVAMRLVADAPEERYPTAELAAHDLLLCQAAPRDGRGELVRLLDERFPPPERQHARARFVHWLEPDRPSHGPRTATMAPPALNEAPLMLGLRDASEWPDEDEGEQRPTRWRLLRARVLWWIMVVLVAETAALPVLIAVE